jgi:predicted aldo/keto reductase-like oxidoreductase
MAKKITYNLNSTRATFYQKRLFLNELEELGCSLDVFIAHALNRLNWREVREIGYTMISIKEKEDQVWENPTDMESVNA